MSTRPPLRIGVLGCANIARQFARDVAASRAVRIVAAASRRLDTAAAFANACGIARHHGSYEALLADGEVDAVYLPLPNSMHAEWAIRAAEHGKHVLCEKPLALGLDEARAMFEAAGRHGVVLLESFPYLFQPQTASLRALLDEGAIGSVRSMQAGFCFTVSDPETNIRMKLELGGGALLDAGSYAVGLIRLVMNAAPQRVHADATLGDSGVDVATMATLHYADGRRAQLSCAIDAAYHRHATIEGSLGAIETDFMNHTSDQTQGHPWGYAPGRLRVRRGTAITTRFEDVPSRSGSGFVFAAEAFAGFVAQRQLDAAGAFAEMSLDNAATLEAIASSARTGAVVAVRRLSPTS